MYYTPVATNMKKKNPIKIKKNLKRNNIIVLLGAVNGALQAN